LGHVIDFDVKELKIVEHHLLDDSLEPGKITEAIQNSCWKTLQMLTSQYRDLLDCQDLMPNDLPLGPKVIEAAVSDAIRDQPWRHKAKHRLASAIRWGLAARVNLLYSDLVELLKARDLKAFAETEDTHGRDVCLMEGMGTEVTVVATAPVANQDKKPPVDRERQMHEHAAEASNREVVRCLGSSSLPHSMADFLARHWRDYLILACIQEGQDSPAWREGVRTMDDLVWSLSAKTSREDVVRLKEGLPDLLRRLSQGMDALALPQSERDRFLISLVKHHSDAVQQCAPSVPMASPTLLHPQDAATQAPLPNMAAPVPPSAPPSETLPEAQPANEERRPDPGLAEIKVGTWLEFLEPDGNNKELKLAWVSPHRNLYLLTNRRGERALSLMAEDFAARLQEGRARVIRPAKTPSNGAASGKSSKKTA
jgi:hypothetical protein